VAAGCRSAIRHDGGLAIDAELARPAVLPSEVLSSASAKALEVILAKGNPVGVLMPLKG
jgi:hypothetical protein